MTSSFRDAEHSGWSARADSYDRMFTPISNQAIPRMIALLGDLRGKRVLDICCGSGHLTAALANKGATAEGIDFASAMVAKASAIYPTVSFREGDAEALDYADGSFDGVVCCYGIVHLSRPDLAIAEAFRVLKPGGAYVFTQWALADELLTIVSAAVAEHGGPVQLPPAPPLMRFGEPEECRRALIAAGFSNVAVENLDISWKSNRPEPLLDLIAGGTVRAAMMIDSQEPGPRAMIREAIVNAARVRTTDGVTLIRRPTVLAFGEKPAA
ncbi:methyltransferase domain-containing protein [Bradyrhizobium sp. WYCCWR 12699]|uniref:class I SAM-dependent methyltransferase n=1 Tax=Bradyrhizobium sp. WYCCWR 12699 TaxID=3064203 RepID=UPI0028A45050|nr:methyltransferase domain-containing protein [Bradyrhizobium sp. WYCCWR 12699]MDT4739920.1 methyltransferase domain-containing protein [Bradyrhizobium sp. WYCCWR 12699]